MVTNLLERKQTMKDKLNKTRILLAQAMQDETRARKSLAELQESIKRIEDVVVKEIWADESLKNDRARNEAKHLARVNDARMIEAQTAINNAFVELARIQASIIMLQSELQIDVIDYELATLGRRDAMLQFAMKLAQVVNVDTATSMAVHRTVEHGMSSTGTLESVSTTTEDETVNIADTYVPTCQSCGTPHVIASFGIRKGKHVHGIATDEALKCPANAGSMTHPLHPDYVVTRTREPETATGSVTPGGARLENRRETPAEQEARERIKTKANIAATECSRNNVGWATIGATQHFFGLDLKSLCSFNAKTECIIDPADKKPLGNAREHIRLCADCSRLTNDFFAGAFPSAGAYGRPDEDARLDTGANRTGKPEKINGIQI
jgi:hypothetical protein